MKGLEGSALALAIAAQYGQTDGAHHKMWVIDQMVRALTGCEYDPKTEALAENEDYLSLMAAYEQGDEYEWDRGIAP